MIYNHSLRAKITRETLRMLGIPKEDVNVVCPSENRKEWQGFKTSENPRKLTLFHNLKVSRDLKSKPKRFIVFMDHLQLVKIVDKIISNITEPDLDYEMPEIPFKGYKTTFLFPRFDELVEKPIFAVFGSKSQKEVDKIKRFKQNQNFFVQAALLEMHNKILEKEKEIAEYRQITEDLNHHLDRLYLLLEQKNHALNENKNEIENLNKQIENLNKREELLKKELNTIKESLSYKFGVLFGSTRFADLIKKKDRR